MSGPAPADGQVLAVAELLLACASAGLAATPEGAPDHAYLVPGAQVAWDYCHCGGQLTVHIRTTYPSEIFPAQVLGDTSCDAAWTVVEYVVTVLRCMQVQDAQGNPPPTTAINAAALIDFADRQAVRKAVACCQLTDGDRRGVTPPVVLQEQLGVGHQGQCVGSELHVLVGLPNCKGC